MITVENYSAAKGKEVLVTKTNGKKCKGVLLGLCEDETLLLELSLDSSCFNGCSWCICELQKNEINDICLSA